LNGNSVFHHSWFLIIWWKDRFLGQINGGQREGQSHPSKSHYGLYKLCAQVVHGTRLRQRKQPWGPWLFLKKSVRVCAEDDILWANHPWINSPVNKMQLNWHVVIYPHSLQGQDSGSSFLVIIKSKIQGLSWQR
jgi:hypothetical protein